MNSEVVDLILKLAAPLTIGSLLIQLVLKKFNSLYGEIHDNTKNFRTKKFGGGNKEVTIVAYIILLVALLTVFSLKITFYLSFSRELYHLFGGELVNPYENGTYTYRNAYLVMVSSLSFCLFVLLWPARKGVLWAIAPPALFFLAAYLFSASIPVFFWKDGVTNKWYGFFICFFSSFASLILPGLLGRSLCWNIVSRQKKVSSEKTKAVFCAGENKDGSRCKNKTTHPSGRCHLHR